MEKMGQNVVKVPLEHFLFEERCMQGVCPASLTVFVQSSVAEGAGRRTRMRWLHRVQGWLSENVPGEGSFSEICECLQACVSAYIVHVRLVLVKCPHVTLPLAYTPFWSKSVKVILEVSLSHDLPAHLDEACFPPDWASFEEAAGAAG